MNLGLEGRRSVQAGDVQDYQVTFSGRLIW